MLVKDIIAKAQQATGLSDLGDPFLLEGLEQLPIGSGSSKRATARPSSSSNYSNCCRRTMAAAGQLNNPWHPLFLDDLTAVYPDAQLVMTHRDPVEVVGSTCSLIRHVRPNFSDVVDLRAIAEP